MSYTIYALKDPLTDDIRYIGATQLPLFLRLEHHLRDIYSEEQNSPRVRWLRKLATCGLEATIQKVAFVEAADPEEAGLQEQLWIEHFEEQGCNLLNVRKGGGGLSPRNGLSRWALDRLGAIPDTAVAKHEGKHPNTIGYRRRKLGIPVYREPGGIKPAVGNGKQVIVTFLVSPAMKSQIKAMAYKLRLSQSELFRQSIDEFLAKLEAERDESFPEERIEI